MAKSHVQIEVVKCRAQVENQASSKSLGSFGIARLIVREEGLKGISKCLNASESFLNCRPCRLLPWRTYNRVSRYHQFRHLLLSMYWHCSSCHCSWLIHSPILDISFRRLLRGDYPFSYVASPSSSHAQQNLGEEVTPLPELAEDRPQTRREYTIEILQTLAAGGLAGSMSAIVPYPSVQLALLRIALLILE